MAHGFNGLDTDKKDFFLFILRNYAKIIFAKQKLNPCQIPKIRVPKSR
jgi:hypothetical protein